MGQYRSPVDDRLILPGQVRLTQGTEHALRLLGRTIPGAIPVRLVIDTGSKRSCLTPTLLNLLRATVAGHASVETSLGIMKTELCWVRLEFPGSALAAVPHLAVARLPLPRSLHEFHGLVGRDLLARWESFLYEGRRGRLTIRDTLPGLFGWFRHG